MKELTIGTRDSRLAVIQAELLRDFLQKTAPELTVRLLPMKTTGDKILDRPLSMIGGKGLFVKELDRALLEGRTDLSVHSLKDVPMEVPEDLPLMGFSRREDPRDVLVLPQGETVWDRKKPVGCAGGRRSVQLSRLYPGLPIAPIRGNVSTRLQKLDRGEYGAIVLAAAGLNRLGLSDRISRYFSVDELLPAAGQGILAVQGRKGQPCEALNGFFDEEATACALAERAFVAALSGGCSAPVAAYGYLEADTLVLTGLFCEEDGSHFAKGTRKGPKAEPERLGAALAEQLKREAYHGR